MVTRKTAIITGASSGIGRQTAIALANAGWNVSIAARREAELQDTASSLPKDQCLVLAGDITNEEFVAELFAKTVAVFGRLDLLFNNAGILAPLVPMEDLSVETFRRVLDVNLVGAFICTQHAIKAFKTQSPQGGRIINNGSIAAQVPRVHAAAYTCSKFAITGLTRSTALDNRAFNIACTQIDIGNAHTALAEDFTRGTLQPDGRVVVEATFDVRHVVDAILHIASLPNDVTVLDFTIMPTGIPFVGRG